MTTIINNDKAFRRALDTLDPGRQRLLGGQFVRNVLSLCEDPRVARALETAEKPDAPEEELAAAHKAARGAVVDCHTRCGAEGDWSSQAGYFVARAVAALVSPTGRGKPGEAVWQAAVNCRMARTAAAIDSGEVKTAGSESEAQYRLLEQFLESSAAG